MKKTKAERIRIVLSHLSERPRGDQGWFLDQVVRLADWRPGKATVSRFFHEEKDVLAADTVARLDWVLEELEKEARAVLRTRLAEIGK